MARSFRKNLIVGWTCCQSEKWNKRIWHRKFRLKNKKHIQNENETMPHIREISNTWQMCKNRKFLMNRVEVEMQIEKLLQYVKLGRMDDLVNSGEGKFGESYWFLKKSLMEYFEIPARKIKMLSRKQIDKFKRWYIKTDYRYKK